MSNADWYADPSGRFTSRFWDGTTWTDLCAGAAGGARDDPDPTWPPPITAPALDATAPPSVEMRFCVFCGAELVTGQRFCLMCGAEIPVSGPVPPVVSNPAAPPILPASAIGGEASSPTYPTVPITPEKPRLNPAWMLVIVLVVMGGVIALAIGAGRGSKSPSAGHEACAAGDMSACDRLYIDSSYGTPDETFGSTCGGTQAPQSGQCEQNFGSTSDSGTASPDHVACSEGDFGACDRLYNESPAGSAEETFGSTCGGTELPQDGDCDTIYDP